MKLEAAIKEYLIEIEIRKYTPKTIRGYKSNLYLFLHFIQKDTPEIDDLTLADVRRFTKYMVDRGNKGTYINGILKTLKSFIQYCYEEGYGGFNTKKSFKWCKEEKPVILAYKPKDVRSMLKECGGSGYYDIRDKTIITMFIETGIRNSELCNIKPEDIHNDFILINGKNHKQRVVPVTPILKKAMVKYDREKEKYFAIRQVENYYFLSRTGRRLTPEANENILKKRGSEICGVRVSPHTCRHFYAQQQLQMGTDLYTISRLLGHENIQITQTYLNSLRDEEIIESNKTRSVILNMGQSLNETNPFFCYSFSFSFSFSFVDFALTCLTCTYLSLLSSAVLKAFLITSIGFTGLPPFSLINSFCFWTTVKKFFGTIISLVSKSNVIFILVFLLKLKLSFFSSTAYKYTLFIIFCQQNVQKYKSRLIF